MYTNHVNRLTKAGKKRGFIFDKLRLICVGNWYVDVWY